jgi:glycosyltransferase involved in cell wall biosynthesis
MLPVKRWDRLLQIVAALKERGFGFRLELAGDGPLRGALEEQARNLDVTDRVIFRGYTDDVPALLCASTFLAHTSDFEGCPNVVMEAMASGRSVVATDVGDIPHIVEDGKTGFVVRCGDDETFVQRMATLISDRDLCQRMGDAARAKAERDFALSRVVSETFSVYRAAGWTNC